MDAHTYTTHHTHTHTHKATPEMVKCCAASLPICSCFFSPTFILFSDTSLQQKVEKKKKSKTKHKWEGDTGSEPAGLSALSDERRAAQYSAFRRLESDYQLMVVSNGTNPISSITFLTVLMNFTLLFFLHSRLTPPPPKKNPPPTFSCILSSQYFWVIAPRLRRLLSTCWRSRRLSRLPKVPVFLARRH